MKKNNLKLAGCIAAAALFLTLPALVFAESLGIGTKPFSLGPRATYSHPKDADEGKWYGGAQARLHFSPVLGLEGSIDYRRNDFSNHTTIKSYPVQASLLAYLMPSQRWSPFLLGGGGWYFTRVEGPADFSHTSSRFGLHAGGGVEVMLNESISLDGSYRYVWLEDVTSRNEHALDKTYRDSGSMITIALNFLF